MMHNIDVILAAHGAGAGSAANDRVLTLARTLEHVIGARVRAAFKQGAPTYREALLRADRPTCLIVPLLTSDGYYATELRREVTRWSPARLPAVLTPIGAHPALGVALASRVLHAVHDRGFLRAHTCVLVVGHGTRRHRNSGNTTRALAAAIGGHTGLATHAAFLDDDPSVEDVLASLPAGAPMIVVPFLMGGGGHAEQDIPRRVLRHRTREHSEILAPLWEFPGLDTLVERSVRDAAGNQLLPRSATTPPGDTIQ